MAVSSSVIHVFKIINEFTFLIQASPRLQMDEYLVQNVWRRIHGDTPSDTIFDEVQARVCDLLQEEQFFPTFKRSQLYIKLLAELDLLKDQSKGDEPLTQEETDGELLICRNM